MMKKVIKKLLAALLAVAMVCAMAIPAFAENSEGDVDSHHTYSAFQIFKGDVEGNNIKDFKISNVDWGSNIINNSDDFLNKLREADHIGPLFTNAKSAQEVLAVISQWHDSDDYSIAFARFVCHYLYSNDANPTYVVRAGSNALTIPEAKAGYYLFVDTTDFSKDDSYHSYNSFLLMVTKGNWNVPITPKAEKPTVEKKVYDNPDGTSTGGFGSSADHAINEKFQFQLTATLPDSTNRAYDYYDKYSVIFHDTLSDGITYDKDDELDSVVIKSNGNTYNITDSSKYTIDTTDLESQNSFVVNIDVKACAKDAGFDLNDGATITVTYTAHLNDKAYVNTAGGSTSNINKVYLTYSNNPKDESSIGKTPESTPVYVYTYQLNNTKHQDTEKGPALEGAGFRLYSDKACTPEQEVKLYKKDNFYYPIKDATDKAQDAVEMFSDEHGQFNVKGLDAGTYYLRETKTPDGYSACPDTTIVISATHDVNHVDLSGNLSTTIINKKDGGITLPSTGGIGTTLFYVVGGGLMVAAIVLLVTKKRMENK